MKKLFLTLIVVLAYFGSAFAQGFEGVNPNNYESHWSFNYHDYLLQKPFVAAITIDGQLVSLENNADNWSSLEVAAFITNASGGEECRANMMWLTDEYVLEYGDPYLTIDGFPIYYTEPGGTVYFKMYDHANNIEYTECTITYEGAPYTVTAGTAVSLGWGDGLETVMLNFTASTEPTCGIELNADGVWTENFESATNTELLPLEQHDACWTWTRLVELPADYQDTLPHLYYKADDDAHAQFAHDNYSLRLWNRGTYAMPILDSTININDLKMSFYTRHSYSFYTLMVGVMDDPTDPETFVPVAYVDNGASLNMEYFEFNFANYEGEGRYIAFKNVRPSNTAFDGNWGDVHSINYIDDITISLMEEVPACVVEVPYTNNFDNVTTSTNLMTGATPECWELVQWDVEEMPLEKMPQVYYKNTLANSGNYSLRLTNLGVFAMPSFGDVDLSTLQLSMYVRQPNARYQLQVGVWDGQAFTPVALVNNESTGYEQFVCDFSNYDGQGGRIAFRNTLSAGGNLDYSINYIDNIEISTFDVEPCTAVTMLNDVETFENYVTFTPTANATGVQPTCWEVVQKDVDMAYDKYPQVYHNPNFGQGSYTLRMADRCVYAMPELEDGIDLNEVTLTMTLRQPNTQYQLEVGVWEFGYDENQEPFEQFVPVATFHNNDNTVTEVSCDFASYTGTGNRVAFRNTLKTANYNYSYNYLDDITLTLTESKIAENSNANVIDEIGVERYLEGIVVYPNPTVGELHIGAVDVQKVECYNQMGQLVAVYNNESNISLNSLANGVYTLRITVPQGVTMRKIVKE